MRPLYHPPVEEITPQGILYALADPTRVAIFMQLAKAECPKSCSTFLKMGDTPLPKSTLSQHFKILREAGLIRSERKGVELQNHSRCADLKDRFGQMITAIVHAYEQQEHAKAKGSSKRKRK